MSDPAAPSEEQQRELHYGATLVGVVECTPYLRILRVRPDGGVPSFQPGQYVTLGLGFWEPRVEGAPAEALRPGQEARLCKRPYSLSHPILDEAGGLVREGALDYLELYVTLIDRQNGRIAPGLTPRLWKLREGDRLHVATAVAGEYTLAPVQPGDDVLFFATGTGEAPHNAMLWELLRGGHQGRIVSVVGARYQRDLGYQETHRRLEARFPAYHYLARTTREPGDAGPRLYLQDYVGGGHLEHDVGFTLVPGRTHAFLCGNPEMIGIPRVKDGVRTYPSPRGIIEVLEEKGLRADNRRERAVGSIHFEEYW